MTQVCVICNQEIPAGRLECVPDTQLCLKHAQAAEKYGGEFKVRGVYGNVAKAGSLKRNYGDVEVLRRPNPDAIARVREEYENESQ